MQRLIVAMTGATGAIFGIRLLEALQDQAVETHLVISKWAERTIEHETPYSVAQVRALAAAAHPLHNQAHLQRLLPDHGHGRRPVQHEVPGHPAARQPPADRRAPPSDWQTLPQTGRCRPQTG